MFEKTIRVLMVVNNLRVTNGIASFAMNYFRRLDHKRVHMDFCFYQFTDSSYLSEIEQAGCRYFLLPSVKNMTAHKKAIAEILKNGQYDIVHDNVLILSFPFLREAKKQGVPVRILHSHNSKLGETPFKEKRNAAFIPLLKRNSNAFAACSDLAAKAMFGDADYELIPNLIDPEKFDYKPEIRTRVRRKMQAEDKRIIVSVGRISAQKNPFFAVDVFEKVAEKMPEVEYWWIGGGPLEEQLKEYVNKKRLQNRVRLLGNRIDIDDLYQAVDLFFLPSVFEGFGIVCIEAQVAGLPCVVSDQVPEDVDVTGCVVFNSLNLPIENWAECVCNLLIASGERQGMKEYLLKSRYSMTNADEVLEKYYRRLVELPIS